MKRLPWLLPLLVAGLRASAADYVVDPLTDPGSPGLGVRGGAFSANGWTTSAATDTVWWTIEDALESGSVSFDVTGLATCPTTCTGDNDLFTLYQAPDGVAAPIDYSPYYRNNDLRVFVRMFSTNDTVNGAMKLELAGCPVGSPYYDNTCPSSCTALGGIAYCNGQATDCGWDPSHTYHFELDWGGGTMSYLRDGVVLGSVGYPSTFAPKPLVVQLGSPRNGQVSGSSIPIGATFTNVRISGTAGAQTPACNAGAPPPLDAGTVNNPCTGGDVGTTGDVTAASWVSGVFTDPGDLNVEGDASGNPNAIVYAMFPPTGGPVSQATLTLHTQTFASAHGGSGQVCLTASSAWDENTLTWSSRPALTALCTGGARTVDPDQEVSWDVTALINAASGPVSLALVSADPDGAHFYSKESGGCGLGPRLSFVLAPPPPPEPDAGTTAAPDAGAAPSGGRDAGGSASPAPSGAGPGRSPATAMSSSCGCAGSPAGLAALAFGALLVLCGRRRGTRQGGTAGIQSQE